MRATVSMEIALINLSNLNSLLHLCYRDCEEIDALIEVLQRDFHSKQIVLLGYSTGMTR